MASLNSLTGLYPLIFNAVDVVSREHTDSVMAVNRDATFEMAFQNQVVRSPVAPIVAASDITPGAYAPDAGGQTISYVEMAINKFKKVDIQWTGEEQGAVGGNYSVILANQFKQAFRTLNNLVAADVVNEAVANASRAYGTSGTSPFGIKDDLSDIAAMGRILDDNGAPGTDRHLVLSPSAKQTMYGKQAELFKVNEAGTADLLRQGKLTQVQNFGIHSDFFLGKAAHTAGTGASYVLNGAHAVGATTVTVKTGTGTVLAGDAVLIGGFVYVVKTALSSTTFTITAPGLFAAGADGDAVAVQANFTPSFACHEMAIQLATRQPAMPEGGDNAIDVMGITDPTTGITYQVALYKAYRQMHMEVALAWGVKANKQEHIALLLG